MNNVYRLDDESMGALGTLQLRALGFLNSVFPLDEPRLTYLDHRAALGQHSPMHAIC